MAGASRVFTQIGVSDNKFVVWGVVTLFGAKRAYLYNPPFVFDIVARYAA
jgi:hypothetical protein